MGVVVVGAGIVGASVAYHLGRLGPTVTLVDKSVPAGGATGDSFAWIGDSGTWPGGAEVLRPGVLADWRRLEAELPALRVRWSGSLRFSEASVADVPGHVVGAAAIEALEPNLRIPSLRAVHEPQDGAVDPVAATRALVQGAQEAGCDLRLGTFVKAIRVAQGHVVGVETSAGLLEADTVVLTAGVETAGLCAPIGLALPVDASPAILMRFTAPAQLVKTLIAMPRLELRQELGGDLLAATHHQGEFNQRELDAIARETTDTIRSSFRRAANVQLRTLRVAARPMPAGGPIVGFLPQSRGLYVAVMHSGITLAPLVGRLAAEEIATGLAQQQLDACRPRLMQRRDPASSNTT